MQGAVVLCDWSPVWNERIGGKESKAENLLGGNTSRNKTYLVYTGKKSNRIQGG
jgi:hypothetical protein